MVMNVRTNAKNTIPSYGKGLLNVHLSWQSSYYSERNLDLHIFEPNNSHVYYMINASANGKMDYVSSYYPSNEHYYSNCNNTEGNYTIKVNFFNGYAPDKNYNG